MSNNITINNKTIELLFTNVIADNKWELFFELINSKVIDLNFRDDRGRNALFWAMHKKNLPVIKKLIELKIDTTVSTGLSAMNYAVYKDNVKIIKTLRSCGLDINEGDEVNTSPLSYAVLYNKINSINYLLESGADIHHEDFFGHSPLSLVYDLRLRYLIEKFEALL